MSTIIKLQRQGAPHKPFWRIIVTDSRHPNGTIELLGTYDNLHKPVKLQLDGEKAKVWLAKGALPTPSMKKILQGEGLMPGKTKVAAAAK